MAGDFDLSSNSSSNSSSPFRSPAASTSSSRSVITKKVKTQIRYRSYSARYKRKRVQKELNSQIDIQTKCGTAPPIPHLSSESDELSSDDDFYSCVDVESSASFQDFYDSGRLSDFTPDSSDTDDVDFDDEDFLVRNILLRHYEDGSGKQEIFDDNDVGNDERPTFRQLFSVWVTIWGICQNAVDDLLSLFRSQSWGLDLPKTCRSLLKTPRSVNVKDIPPGKYHHFGILNGIIRILNLISESDIPFEIFIFVNVDGLPIAKSSGSQLWPILAMISNIHFRQVFCVGLFHGSEKPHFSCEYLADFISEALNLCNNGFTYKDRPHILKIDGFICDAPARSFILGVKSHSGYFGCTRCIQQGEYLGRVVFLERDSPARTDQSFRNRQHEDHHVGDSILERLDIDMVKDIPLDPMHLVKLGVSRKLLLTWIRGPLQHRLLKSQVLVLSSRLEDLRDYVPKEYPRKTRSLKFVDRMKATEHGFVHSCVGPVIFMDILPPRVFNNFLVFHVAITILSYQEFCHTQNDYARDLLKFFVEEAEEIYGSEFLSYNVHSLIHLPDDVLRYGSLPNFSAFPFENYMQTLKKLIRKSDKPLQQIAKRLVELGNFDFSKNKKEVSVHNRVFRFEHDKGPLLPGLRFRSIIQYRELRVGPWHLTCKIPNSCIYLKVMTVFCIENIIKTENNSLFIGRRFNQTSDLYSYPIRFSCYHIYSVSLLSDRLEALPIDLFQVKAVQLPIPSRNGSFAVFPLHFENHH
ncbi:uncharacterized protein LOC116918629 [Daphnia magna]|uniref:uncharacterized protein LOC116918629 n=1 Tax=Daphnia magna TaxID=35525 RepID=UPI001E1BB7C5|nr:uncharacterized protein LOC116918629 [Daphnia magna]